MRVTWAIAVPASLCVALAALNWRLLSTPPSLGDYELDPRAAWTPEPLDIPKFRTASIDTAVLGETLARPLFSPDRRPPKPPEPKVEVAEPAPVEMEQRPQLPPFELKGVLFVRDVRKVLLASPDVPDGQWVGIGDTVMGWDLQVMTPEGATFRSGDHTHRLNLYRSGADAEVGRQSSQ